MIEDVHSGQSNERRGWWAVYTKHQHEKRVADMLLAKGSEVFLPLYTADRHRRDRDVRLALPLFPCYVFARENPEMRLAVLSTPGVHLIVSRGPAFGVVPYEEIDNLRVAIAAERVIEPHPYCRIGDRVRITRGALVGLEGIMIRQKGLCRVIISIEMLAKSIAVEVDISEIGPAQARPSTIAGALSSDRTLTQISRHTGHVPTGIPGVGSHEHGHSVTAQMSRPSLI